MIVSHIAAMSENRVIGRAGGMPWHIPEDFKFFKETTMGHAMIMGRKTWDSIGRALPGRLTIVVTRDKTFSAPNGVLIKDSIKDAISYCETNQDKWGKECFIVGGGEIYKQSINTANRLYLTMIHQTVEGDTLYPEIPPQEFKQIKNEPKDNGSFKFSFTTWERVRAYL
jgi:dihydrofolate reductase